MAKPSRESWGLWQSTTAMRGNLSLDESNASPSVIWSVNRKSFSANLVCSSPTRSKAVLWSNFTLTCIDLWPPESRGTPKQVDRLTALTYHLITAGGCDLTSQQTISCFYIQNYKLSSTNKIRTGFFTNIRNPWKSVNFNVESSSFEKCSDFGLNYLKLLEVVITLLSQ